MASANSVLRKVVFVSLFAAAPATAQQARLSYGIGAGLIAPVGVFHKDQFGSGFNSGWEGMALVEFKLPKSASMGVRFEGSYSQNSTNDRFKAVFPPFYGGSANGKARILGGSVDLTLAFRSSRSYSRGHVTGSVLAGFGMYNFKLSLSSGTMTYDTSKTKFTWNAGGGLSYNVGGAALFLEVRYFVILEPFGSDIRYLPIIAGVRLGM